MSVFGLFNSIIMLTNAEVRLALSVSYEDRKAVEKAGGRVTNDRNSAQDGGPLTIRAYMQDAAEKRFAMFLCCR